MEIYDPTYPRPSIKVIIGESHSGASRIKGKSRQMTLYNTTLDKVCSVVTAALKKEATKK